MTLGDDLIDEYSRHILVPEIGPTGQARLLATRVVVAGGAAAHSLVHELLARSGLRVVDGEADVAVFLGVPPTTDAPRPSVVCWERDDVLHAWTLTRRPCPACVMLPSTPLPTSPLATQALATLAATVLVLRVAAPAEESTAVRLDLGSGRLETDGLTGTGCGRCAATDRAAR